MNAQTPIAADKPSPPKNLPSVIAGGPVRALVPQDMDGAWRMAGAVHAGGIVPYGIDTREKAMIAIMHGLEIGLTPMNAMQSIAVINGKPTIYGDAAIGLVRASGLMEWIKETIEGEGDAMMARCVVKRKNEAEPITGEFSVADAKVAGLWTKTGKNGQATPWQTYPKRMLKFRARAFALRDGFADVLKGMHIREEVEDYDTGNGKVIDHDDGPPAPPPPPTKDAPPTQPAESDPIDAEFVETDMPQSDEDEGPPDPTATATAAADAKPSSKIPTEPEAFIAWARDIFGKCDAEMLAETYTVSIEPHVPPEVAEDVMGLYRQRERELEGAPPSLKETLLAEIREQTSRINLIKWTVDNRQRRAELGDDTDTDIETAVQRKLVDLKAAERK